MDYKSHSSKTTDCKSVGAVSSPNPGSGIFIIESPGGEMEIHSYTGAILYRIKIESGKQSIDLSKLVDGCYNLSLTVGNSRVKKTLIILKD